ncbi:hypothetical protein T02_947, partial [Trichinella nativa]
LYCTGFNLQFEFIQAIDKCRGHSVFATIASFIANYKNIKVLAYSNDPPNLSLRNEESRTKGYSKVDD